MAKPRTWTDNTVKNLRPRTGQRQTDYSDPAKTGLVLRVTQQGGGDIHRQWRRKYRVAKSNTQRTVIIGDYPGVGLAAARNEAARIKETAKRGHDPLEAQHEIEAERMAAGTFAELVEIILSDAISPKTRKPFSDQSTAEMRRSLSTLSEPFRNKPALDATSKDVGAEIIATYNRSRKRGGHGVMANRLLAYISSVFRRAQQLQLVPAAFNPARDVQPPAGETARDRVLDEDEIKTLEVYLRSSEGKAGTSIRQALQLALVTAQRIGEVCSARVDDLDLDAGTWTIRNTKNGRTHLVPLSGLAVKVIQQAMADGGEYLFPSTSKAGYLRTDSINTALYRDHDVIGIEEHWTPHDLRRTAATGMGRLGVTRFIQDRVLNHTDGGVGAIYDRHEYLSEKRLALDLWAAELQRITAGKEPKGIAVKRALA